MQIKTLYIALFSLILLSTLSLPKSKTTNAIQLITKQTHYEAGSVIVLEFSSNSDTLKPLLYCANSYGTTLITPILERNILSYKMPEIITNKSGLVNWKLLQKKQNISGLFTILPKQQVHTMETYIGPPSIEAGGNDYSMLVVIPTDSLDNPLEENTAVNEKHQFLNLVENETIFTKNLIAYKNIYSKEKSGRMLVASESKGKNSKEFTVNIMPAIPTDFKITAKRPHNYADGNQVTTFFTSIVKDKYNNIVSDGTYVDFFISDSNGSILKTSGTTIKGIAQSKIIHPDYKDSWSVKAYVHGISESNTLKLNYLQVISDFEVSFSKNNRSLKIGPLQSFMQQMIPDGLQVELLVYKDKTEALKRIKTTFNGYVNFNLKSAILANGNYSIHIKTAGITKEFNNKTLW